MKLPLPMLLYAVALLLLGPARGEAGWKIEEQTIGHGALRHVHMVAAEGGQITLDAVLFDQRKAVFRVVDNPGNAQRLGDAMQASKALAGVNGGFFHADDTPLGLVISDRQRLHPYERAKLLSGLLVVTGKGISILRSGEYTAKVKAMEALQAGPFLVDRGRVVPGLNDTRRAARTVIIGNGKGGFGVLLCRSATLAGTARMLAEPQLLPGFPIARALNLDGGSSSALWLRTEPPFYAPEWKRVRNFLAIEPR